MNRLLEQLERILPGTECQKCGFDSCRSYARAMLSGEVGVNLCPPGGEPGRALLAAAIRKPLEDIDPIHTGKPGTVVVVEEVDCIGCAKCIKICPTDAIIGSKGKMHTVAEQWCSGCNLCVPVCPTDCIKPVSLTSDQNKISKDEIKARVRRREERLKDRFNEPESTMLSLVDVAEHSKEELKKEIESAVCRRRDS